MYDKCVNYLKDAIFPLFCIDCNLEGNIICADCFQKINSDGVLSCPVCHKSDGLGWACADCKPRSYLERHIAITEYNEAGRLGHLLQAFKYRYIEDAREKLLMLVANFVKKNHHLFSHIDAIIPVPLHSRRYAERGFNQADIIANELSSLLRIPKLSCLVRVAYTCQQAKLKKQDRINNVENAFAFVGNNPGAKNKVLLVDDVYTTGSTLQECARTLKENGAKRVVGFTIARG